MFLGTYVSGVLKFTLRVGIHETGNEVSGKKPKPFDLDY
jgi:hypothetical protein